MYIETTLGETNAMNNLDNVVNKNGKSKPEQYINI